MNDYASFRCPDRGRGVAGLSAAVALSGAGARVTLLDRKPYVGGRAYSYLHPALDEVIDSQHVLLGCCTNLIDLCRLAGADRHIRWYDRITFLEPATESRATRRSTIGPTALPSPGHSSLSFLRAPMLSLADKSRIALGLREFLRGYPDDDHEAVLRMAYAHPADGPRHSPLLGAGHPWSAQRQLRPLLHALCGAGLP
jgi:uncharacterized protein with NAD-binding domain and iron-sulfur cluster